MFLLPNFDCKEGKDSTGFSVRPFWAIKAAYHNRAKHLSMFAAAVESGILTFQQRILGGLRIRDILGEDAVYQKENNFYRMAILKWENWNCFDQFRDECSLEEIYDTGIGNLSSFHDLIVIWLLFILLSLLSSALFLKEFLRINQ